MGTGYFFVWALFGAAAYPLGILLTEIEMRSPALARAVPLATGLVLLLAGCLQLTSWKARQLGHCRGAPACVIPSARAAWRHGLHLGIRCSLCCAGFMAILLVTGVMNLIVMAIVAAAIAVERIPPRPERAARVAGVAIMAIGVFLTVRAALPH